MRKTVFLALLAIAATGCTTAPSESTADSAARCRTAGITAEPALSECVRDRQLRNQPRNRAAIGPNGEVIVLE